jgi:hypothetical protein
MASMLQQIREQIRVAAIFGPGDRIRPVWFDWHNRKYTVREITYRWQEREGSAIRLHFAVSDGTVLYELCYHTISQIWFLAAVEPS